MRNTCRAAVLLLAMLALPAAAQAQARGTLQGRVMDGSSGQPLPGVEIALAAARLTAITDEGGRYLLLNVPAGEWAVQATSLGFADVELRVTIIDGTTTTANFTLTPTALRLEQLDVVVTALGIERKERTITTSVQQVTADQIARVPDANLVAALSGKVAGVDIRSSNTAGGSSRMVIRGAGSLTGNNQPLFVVDGIPVSNATGSNVFGSRGYNAIDYGNALSDLQPADIESISVLKGPNAAALYGSRAANGAVIITTRNARRAAGLGMGVTATSAVTFERPLKLPDYQDLYGQGSNGRYAYVNGKGGGTYDDTDESWGPRLDMGLSIPQFFSNGQPAPWVSHPDNVRNFFETGVTVNSSVSFASTTEKTSSRLSVAQFDQDGMYPGFDLKRTTIGLNSSLELTPKLRGQASVQYIDTDGANRPAQGYGADNFMFQFMWFGRQVDTKLLRDRLYNEDGTQFNWNSRWNNNPYWTALINGNNDHRDRVIGSGSLSYDVLPWLTATLRAGTDWSQEERRREFAASTYGQTGVDPNGAFGVNDAFRQEINADFLLSTKPFTRGDFTLSGNLGGNRRDDDYRASSAWVRNLVVPGLYDLGNAAVTPELSDWRERQRVNSLYGATQIGWRNLLFVDVTGRNDWSSTLPAENNSYFYPSVSGALILSDVVRLPAVDYMKVRGGWAQVGNAADPYQLLDPYIASTPFGAVPRYTASDRLRNLNLKPETTESWEIGTELRLLRERLALDLTYYDKVTSNQIINAQISALTGFSSRVVNAGRIRNSGIEALVNVRPVQLGDFTWDVIFNLSKNDNEVEELYGDLSTIVLDTYYTLNVEARKGQPYGQMVGRKYVRDGAGNIVVGTNGLPLNASTNPVGVLGNYNADWTGGLTNRLRYRTVELSFLLDTQQGGSVYSLTSVYGRRSGVLAETLRGRETADANGAPTPVATGGGLIVPGVRVVAGDTVPNDVRVTAQAYWRGLAGLHEEYVFDASYVKLREVRLGFEVPRALTSRLHLSRINAAVIGRNLMLWSDVPHIDPETAFNAGNVQGLEYAQSPSARSLGFSITIMP